MSGGGVIVRVAKWWLNFCACFLRLDQKSQFKLETKCYLYSNYYYIMFFINLLVDITLIPANGIIF